MAAQGALTQYYPIRKRPLPMVPYGMDRQVAKRRRSDRRVTYSYKAPMSRPMTSYRGASKYRTQALKQEHRATIRVSSTLAQDDFGLASFVTQPGSTDSINTWGIRTQYQAIFDEFKIEKVIDKFRFQFSADRLNTTTERDVLHWSCYDADCRGREFTNEASFRQHAGSKWKLMKPFDVATSVMYPVYAVTPYSTTSMRQVDNPWRDIAEFDTLVPRSITSVNGVQHCFVGPGRTAPGQPNQYNIIVERIFILKFRGCRQGQGYKT